MSDIEQGAGADQETAFQPPEIIEGRAAPEPYEDEDEDALTDPEDGEQEEPQTGDVTEPAGLRDERELDRAYDRIRREHERHAKRVQEIIGADFEALAPCPLCSHFAAGYIGLVELPEAAIPTLRAMLGMPDLTTYVAADDARTCPSCEGRGQVLTGSNVPGYETKQCARCKGIGWVGTGAPAPPSPEANGEAPVLTGPTVYEPVPEDPTVAMLRERGFTVIPPMRLEPR